MTNISFYFKLKMFIINEVYIGILGQSNIVTSLDDDKNIFKLIINYNSDTLDYDYYYYGEKLNI
jgi:hypothetical protein